MRAETPAGNIQLAAQARRLIRGARTAALSTILAGNGDPYGSLVLSATCPDAAPILLLSRLAAHTRNLLQNPRAALLYDATGALDDPLTGARLSLVGSIQPLPAENMPAEDMAACRARFLARHPSAADYVDFKDFHFYRMQPERAHLVAGFGRINWIEGVDILLLREQWAGVAVAEADILAHMNSDHADSIALYAQKLLELSGGPWRMAGCDPEGCDLALEGRLARLPFSALCRTSGQVRQELVRLTQLARQKQV